ncbi:hypothetical protein [Azospirillum sp. TSO5]|uniref:hypothetical protein n=1 Tax=Azospirillum sp. TSO5 TaxID=716760 RepID=UPI000D6462F8|nr:hypothetical protein [Azospirillum sp. TSO5]
MAVITSSGYTLSIGTTATNPSGDSYTLIGEIENMPAFGKQFQEITFNNVSNRETQKFKGNYNLGTVTVDLAMDVADGGQTALIAALDADDLYNFRLEYNDSAGSHGSYRIFKARVNGYTENPGNAGTVVKAQAMLSIQNTLTRTAAA